MRRMLFWGFSKLKLRAINFTKCSFTRMSIETYFHTAKGYGGIDEDRIKYHRKDYDYLELESWFA